MKALKIYFFHKGTVTTILGLIIFACILTNIFFNPAFTWSDCLYPLLLSLLLILMPDQVLRIIARVFSNKTPLVVALLFLASCAEKAVPENDNLHES